MNARERFLVTMEFGTPDRIPFVPGFPRESTRKRWHGEGLPLEIVDSRDISEYAYKLAGGTLQLPMSGKGFPLRERMIPEFEERVIEAVVDTAEVEFPPILVEVEIERLIDQQLRRWQMNRDNLENYLRMVNKTEPELREELQPIAAKRVAQSLVLGKIAEAEKIEADESEIDAEVERISQGETENREELQKYLNTPQSRESIRELLISRKTMERLVEIGKSSAAVKKKKSIPTKEVKND